MQLAEWRNIHEKVEDYMRSQHVGARQALAVIAPTKKVDAYYQARIRLGKVKRTKERKHSPRMGPSKGFTRFVPADAAMVKITHPSGCVIECGIAELNTVLTAIKG